MRKNIKKNRRDGETKKQTKWNESTQCETEKVKLDKSKILSYSPAVFKHDSSLEAYLGINTKI